MYVNITNATYILIIKQLVGFIQLTAALGIVLRLNCLNPVSHLLVKFLQGSILKVVFLRHVLRDDCLLFSTCSTSLGVLSFLSIKDLLLLG